MKPPPPYLLLDADGAPAVPLAWRFQGLLAPAERVAIYSPVFVKIVRNLHNFDVRETHCLQSLECRANVGTLLPRAAPAVKNNLPHARNTLNARFEPDDAVRVARRAAVSRSRNMSLRVKTLKAHVQQQRLGAGIAKLVGQA